MLKLTVQLSNVFTHLKLRPVVIGKWMNAFEHLSGPKIITCLLTE